MARDERNVRGMVDIPIVSFALQVFVSSLEVELTGISLRFFRCTFC